MPRAALICALVAFLNAVGWSIVMPPFQVPDEPDHFAYVKQLAETGTLPASSSEQLSREEIDVLHGIRASLVWLRPQDHTIATAAEQAELRGALAQAAVTASGTPGSPSAGTAASEPPLYYALEAVPYTIDKHHSVLARLQLMRLFSSIFGGLTALFAFLFVREALPARRWAWSVGGLAVALAPLLGLMSGAVNPDAMLFAVSAAIFYALARGFRRGLDVRTTIALGALVEIGLLAKLNFAGLVPGVLLGILVLSVRAARIAGRSAYRLLALGWGIALGPAAVYMLGKALSGQAVLEVVSMAARSTHGSAIEEASYIWQLYLPRLPGMTDYFPGLLTIRQLWFDHYVGLYGWLDTPFPGWVDELALIPAVAIALLCARSLLAGRARLRGRLGELLVYSVIAIGLLLLVGASSFTQFPGVDAEFAQVRYLLPLLPLLAAVVTLAARGAGRRWGSTAGALIVILCVAQDVFAQLQVVARYYG